MALDTQVLENLTGARRRASRSHRLRGDVRACESQGSYNMSGSEKLGSQTVGTCLLDIGEFPFICH